MLPTVEVLKVITGFLAFTSMGSLNLKLFMEATDLGMSETRTNGFEKLKLYSNTDFTGVFTRVTTVGEKTGVVLPMASSLTTGEEEMGGVTVKSNFGRFVIGSGISGSGTASTVSCTSICVFFSRIDEVTLDFILFVCLGADSSAFFTFTRAGKLYSAFKTDLELFTAKFRT